MHLQHRARPIVCTPHSVRTILRDIKVVTRRIYKETLTGRMDTLFGSTWCPYGIAGDYLWVRESCRILDDGSVIYRADVPDEKAAAMGPWKNVRFVPKITARIWLEVTDVRVERLHEISDDDAEAEGILESDSLPGFYEPGLQRDPRESFRIAWDTINGHRDAGAHAWAQNPRVWRLQFRRLPELP